MHDEMQRQTRELLETIGAIGGYTREAIDLALAEQSGGFYGHCFRQVDPDVLHSAATSTSSSSGSSPEPSSSDGSSSS
jgi:hypothetical protein